MECLYADRDALETIICNKLLVWVGLEIKSMLWREIKSKRHHQTKRLRQPNTTDLKNERPGGPGRDNTKGDAFAGYTNASDAPNDFSGRP